MHQRTPRALLVWRRGTRRAAGLAAGRERSARARSRKVSPALQSSVSRAMAPRRRATNARTSTSARTSSSVASRASSGRDRSMASSRDSSAAAAAYRLLKGSDSGSAIAHRASTSAIVRGDRSATSARRVSAVALAAARSVAISNRGRDRPARGRCGARRHAVRAARRGGADDDESRATTAVTRVSVY